MFKFHFAFALTPAKEVFILRFRNASVNLRYAFYRYHEPTSGGFNDYTAHAVFAALTLRWP